MTSPENAMPRPSDLRTRNASRAAPAIRAGAEATDRRAAEPARTRARHRDAQAQESNVAIQDWDAMLSAVKHRLTLTATQSSHVLGGTLLPAGDTRVQTVVLECVSALDQLHLTLRHELGRCQQLELEVFDAESALAQARAELLGTQAGERRARHLARHDDLTSLPNRGHFMERLAHALDLEAPRRRALAVLYLDLDGFKLINDRHGHDAGDQLLRIVAARLRRALRAEDLVSRLGGDEFACLLADLPGRERLCRLAGKLFEAVAAPVKVGALELAVRPSIGIATCPADGVTGAQLLKHADTAMYRAKRQRSGYAFFDQCRS
ncbi:MAG: GGDEF domain-containing protein [Rubrivivax sp.]|nr:GGDEF domain-containing protein [Rubrivivax sp.]